MFLFLSLFALRVHPRDALGTNILMLPNQTFWDFKRLLLSSCKSSLLRGICDVDASKTIFDGYCYAFSAKQLAQYPSLTFHVKGVDLVMSVADYILLNYGPTLKHTGDYCLGIVPGGPKDFIVGDTLMQNYLVVFDHSLARIGFAPVSKQCGNI